MSVFALQPIILHYCLPHENQRIKGKKNSEDLRDHQIHSQSQTPGNR